MVDEPRVLRATEMGMSGLARGQAAFVDASRRVVDGDDAVGAIVDQKLAAAQVKTSATVIRTVDDMLGTLIDTIA
jgi:hypothetical protein